VADDLFLLEKDVCFLAEDLFFLAEVLCYVVEDLFLAKEALCRVTKDVFPVTKGFLLVAERGVSMFDRLSRASMALRPRIQELFRRTERRSPVASDLSAVKLAPSTWLIG
jgi:hypothetical protein